MLTAALATFALTPSIHAYAAGDMTAPSDVPTNAWYYNSVQFVYSRALMNGKGEGRFAPLDRITRGEFATVLYNKENKPQTDYRAIFSDIAEDKWYTRPVMWAFDRKIVKGYGDTGVFGVSDDITREQMAQMLYAYAKNKGYELAADPSALGRFGDTALVSTWAQPAMRWAVTRGVLSGTGDDIPLLNPQGKTTRAECAALIRNLIEKVEQDPRPEAGQWTPDIY